MINMAHKLTTLQAYNFLQVDNKDRIFRTVLCLLQSCDVFWFWFFGFFFLCLFIVDRFAFLSGDKKLYTAKEIMFRKSSVLKEANVNPLKTI